MRRAVGILCLGACMSTVPAAAQEDVVKGLYDNAILLLRQGRPDEALKDLERIYKSYPSSEYADEALHRLGVYHLENRQYQAALDSFNLLISSFGDRNMAPEAYYSIGEIYQNVDFPGFDFEKADANFARVYNIYTRSERVDDALLQSGLLRARLKEFRNARTTLQRLVEEYPQSPLAPAALYHLGLILVYVDEPLLAMELLQRIIDDYQAQDYSLRALRVINNLYRTRVIVPRGGTSPYRADSSFSTRKFRKVTALTVDQQDNLYVATKDAPAVQIFGPDGSERSPITGQRDVRGLFVDPQGTVYVVKDKSVHFGGQDSVLKKKTAKGLEPLEKLAGLVRNAGRTFYVLTEKADSLAMFDRDESYVREFPTFKINDVQGLALDARGDLYILDGKLERLIRIDSNGAVTGTIDKKGNGYSMKKLSRVAVDLTGTVYVLDERDKNVYVFGPDLKLVTTFAPPGLDKPQSLAVDSAGTLYIYDEKEDAIRKYL
jgi:outer membrane protein assembly factor BamD (BamD/ComL family)/sugar lactone lactonase YvrE